MRAIVSHRYKELELDEVDKPRLDDRGRVLVRVRAAAANPLDCHEVAGTLVARPMLGLTKPKHARRGVDVAGVVEAVGAEVTDVAAGDEVFGIARGAFAEYVQPPASQVAPKPPNVSFEEAAAVPVAGTTALIALRDKGEVRPGQTVLVNAAAGGVGTFAVQLAKAFDAEVTGVCSTRNLELVRSLGADHVVDYTREDFTRGGERFDVIVNCVDARSLRDLKRALKPGGRLVMAAGTIKQMLVALATKRFGDKRVLPFIADVRKDDLLFLAKLLEQGTIRAVIDRTYPLAEVPEALRYLETKRARGKVVVLP